MNTRTTNTFSADIEVNEVIINNVLNEQFGLRPNTIKLLSEGFDNAVYLINNHLVFRFPRRARSVDLILREVNLLPKLEKLLSVKIPKPIFLSIGGESFKYPFYGYEHLPGNAGSQLSLSKSEHRAFAYVLGDFLKQVHNLDPSIIAHDPTFDRTDFARLLLIFQSHFEAMQDAYDLNKYDDKIEKIIQLACDSRATSFPRVVVHGDLYHRHLIFNNNKLTAVIDWGEICLSTVAVDLILLWQFLPKEAHEDFFSAYGDVPQSMLHYARFLALFYAVALLRVGSDRNDRDLIRTSLQTMKDI